jgi:hypothetical protein
MTTQSLILNFEVFDVNNAKYEGSFPVWSTNLVGGDY